MYCRLYAISSSSSIFYTEFLDLGEASAMHSKDNFASRKKKQVYHLVYAGYMKWGTHARVFSQALAHWNSQNEIRQTVT